MRRRTGLLAFVCLAAALWLAVWGAFCTPAPARGETPADRRARAALALAAACQDCHGDHAPPAPARPKAPAVPPCPCNPQYGPGCVCPAGRCCCPHCAAAGRPLPPPDFELPWQPRTPYPVPQFFPAPRTAWSPPSVGGFRAGGGRAGGGC
jgi:hypothetical protein